ncbi:MAG: hypothetical protein GQ542_10940 [Desulforhopalus sp.]|nr:hypothetical protein [Desulforhopalus sp.]
MDILILNLIRKRLPSARTMVGMGLAAILALVSVVAVGSALAADTGSDKNVKWVSSLLNRLPYVVVGYLRF